MKNKTPLNIVLFDVPVTYSYLVNPSQEADFATRFLVADTIESFLGAKKLKSVIHLVEKPVEFFSAPQVYTAFSSVDAFVVNLDVKGALPFMTALRVGNCLTPVFGRTPIVCFSEKRSGLDLSSFGDITCLRPRFFPFTRRKEQVLPSGKQALHLFRSVFSAVCRSRAGLLSPDPIAPDLSQLSKEDHRLVAQVLREGAYGDDRDFLIRECRPKVSYVAKGPNCLYA